MAYDPDLSSLLRGYYFDISGFDKSRFTVHAFVQPLYVLFPSIALSYGGRLGTLRGNQERWWSLAKQDEGTVMSEVCALVEAEGEPFLSRVRDPKALIEYVSLRSELTIEDRQTLAYSLAWLGDRQPAIATLRALISAIEATIQKPPWMKAMLTEALTLLAAVEADSGQAHALLHSWRNETVKNIGISASPA
jgi:hypothetical protein